MQLSVSKATQLREKVKSVEITRNALFVGTLASEPTTGHDFPGPRMSNYFVHQWDSRSPPTIASMKARQIVKIGEIARALARLGIASVDDQAETLGLARSTAWTILRARHKSSGLSAATIARMLTSDLLPTSARETIIEYVDERSAGLYGHCKTQRHRFIATLTAKLAGRQNFAKLAPFQPDAKVDKLSRGFGSNVQNVYEFRGERGPLKP